jgi:eukaryotic-like serine/threonine-protein kinase
MPVTRFLAELEIELLQSRNFAAADLFDVDHAKKVLAAFGRAFGKLPEKPHETSKEQKEFLNQAVAGLSRENRIICVRLALFAEMMKGRPWTPATLKELRGTEGVGVLFLEDTFSSRTANPKHRLHQKAARAVLKALLPESGTDITGHMRSYVELLEASGYGNHPNEFDDLIRILDGEIRLLTPTDPEGADRVSSQVQSGQKYYQLTHDYLVPSLRSWLTRKQKETRRGRAELRLAERAASWNAKPENRHLPAWWEWANILLFTRKREWTTSQQKMMTKASRYHCLQTVALVVVLAVAALVGLDIRRQVVEANNATRAAGLVQTLLHADITQVPGIISNIEEYRSWANPLLREQNEKAGDDSRQKLHTSLALLPVDSTQVDYLYGRLLGAPAQEISVLRDALRPHREELLDKLWMVAEQPAKGQEPQRLRAASALASYDPDSPRWAKVQDPIANDLVAVQAVHLATWMDTLRPVRQKLLAPLAVVYRDSNRRETERSLATSLLADYAVDQPEMLTDLLLDADEKQFAEFYREIEVYGELGVSLLQRELNKEPSQNAEEDAKDKLAKRQANAAVALLRMGRPQNVWPLLKHSPDPRLRSYVIHRFSPLGAQPKDVLLRLDEETDVSVRRALLLILGEFSDKDLPVAEREKLLPRLFGLYREDPDPGLHGAVAWLLRQWGHKKELQQVDQSWASDKQYREKRLEHIRRELATRSDTAKPRWYVNSQGQTFAILPGPIEFQMGSPPREADHKFEEVLHRQRIAHSFALATTHVTVEQFKRCPWFAKFNPPELVKAPEPDCPILGTDWYMAAMYCIWLSREEGLPRDQWCYDPDMKGVFGVPGMRLAPNYLERTGYRLPTEAEWEYACRAGARTSRYYGEFDELLGKYAWYNRNSAQRTWPVGSLKPNDFGLFDVYGQLSVWCHDPYEEYGPLKGEENKVKGLAVLGASAAGLLCSHVAQGPLLPAFVLIEKRSNVIDAGVLRVLRGGYWGAPAANLRSAYRVGSLPGIRGADDGFRLARTVRP